MKQRFRSNYNYNASKDGETNLMPSETVPNMSMSIQEIAKRYTRGLPLPKGQQMFYGGDTIYPNMKGMSDMEQADMVRAQQEYVEQKKQELQGFEKKRKLRKAQIKQLKEEQKQREQTGGAQQSQNAQREKRDDSTITT